MYRQSVLLFTLMLSGCVSYVEADADPIVIAAEVRNRAGGAYLFDQAVAVAFRQNPELRALAAHARAAGADLEPLFVENEYRSHTEQLAVMIDPIALLDLGPRGAANDALDSKASAAAIELVTRRWQVAADIAEVFATEAVLSTLSVPNIPVDPDAFERAGLASAVDAAKVRAARVAAIAEREALRTARDRNIVRFRRLLGLPSDADVLIMPALFGSAPVRTDAALLARPDLALATARFRVADAEFRAAVAAQYPSLMIGPEIPLNGSALDWVGVLRLPIGAWGKAKAAEQRREAARAELESAFLDARREVRDAELAITATQADALAARAAVEASNARLAAALAAIEVDIDAFARVAEAAVMAIRDTKVRRMAEVARRLALHDLDVAYGWPAVVMEAQP